MNLIDAWVKEILSEPYEKYGKWWVRIRSVDMGGTQEKELMFNTKEEATALQVGYKFAH